MQKIILSPNPTEIHIDELTGREIVAYRTLGEGVGVCVLSKLNKGSSFGFINIAYSTCAPSYVNEGWYHAVKKAAESRTLFVFKDMDDLIKAIANKSI